MNANKALIFILLTLLATGKSKAQSELISHEKLVEDTRELAQMIENTHPDPYINGGGKIEFHRKLQHILKAIPDTGMSIKEYNWLLQPFTNSVGDGHTAIRHKYFNYDPKVPYGFPFRLSVCADKTLYIYSVAREDLQFLIGAKLVSVEGLSMEELLQKTRRLFPSQNDFDALHNLEGMLRVDFLLSEFLPECKASGKMKIVVTLPGGDQKEINLNLQDEKKYPFIKKETTFTENLPSTEKCDFAYNFLSEDKKTAFLRIDNQDGFREIIESAQYEKFDSSMIKQYASNIFQRLHKKNPPDSLNLILEGIPSVSAVFRNLVEEMKEASTENLIIDLSRNNGGQSILSHILIYYLYGSDMLCDLHASSYSINKYSDYFFQVFSNQNIEDINKEHALHYSFELTNQDYNFNSYEYWLKMQSGMVPSSEISNSMNEEYKSYTSFYKDFKSREYDGHYTPVNVYVLCSANTYSAGFGTLVDLYNCGARIIGIPSGQAANCFGNSVYFILKNTELDGFISTKYIELLPDDPDGGIVLKPQFPLTYDIIKNYDFDPNSLYKYAMDLIMKKAE